MSSSFMMTVADAVAMTGGSLVSGDGSHLIGSVVIDSRKAVPGSLFFALRGEKTDGHVFVNAAAASGAVCCVVEKETAEVKTLCSRGRCSLIKVENTIEALQGLASEYRKKFSGITVIGITGSSGKTTTKELLASMLSTQFETVMNEGNLNSETGLPLSVFRIRESHRFGVFELGINHPGEMDILAGVLRPDYAVVTNIGTAHVGLMGSREKIAEEKMKIFISGGNLKDGIVYEKDAFSSKIASEVFRKTGVELGFFGFDSQKGYVSVKDKGLEGSVFEIDGRTARYQLVGRHNQQNALAAIMAARHFGVAASNICSALENARPLFSRGEIINGAVTVISDCYNSNLESVKYSVDFLESLEWEGRKVLLLGSILELGRLSDEIHEDVVGYALSGSADALFLFGSEFEKAFMKSAGSSGKKLFWTDDPGLMVQELQGYLCGGDIVLIKGSRGMALERFIGPIGQIDRMVSSC